MVSRHREERLQVSSGRTIQCRVFPSLSVRGSAGAYCHSSAQRYRMAFSWNNRIKHRLVCRTYLSLSAHSFGLRSEHGGSSSSLFVRLSDESFLVGRLFRTFIPRLGRKCFLLCTYRSMGNHRSAGCGSDPMPTGWTTTCGSPRIRISISKRIPVAASRQRLPHSNSSSACTCRPLSCAALDIRQLECYIESRGYRGMEPQLDSALEYTRILFATHQ